MRVDIITTSSGQHAYIREGYRDENGRPTKRIIEKLGKVTDLEAADPDWRNKAETRAAELTAAKAAARTPT